MKYKIGDRVKIKSLDWYNENKDILGNIECGDAIMNIKTSQFCGKIVTISNISDVTYTYKIQEDNGQYFWTDEMIEGLVEEEGKETSWKPSKEEMDVLYGLAYITNKYDEHKEEVITRLYQDLKREFFNGSSYENMFPNTENDVRRRSTIQVLEYARSLDNYNQYGKADIDKNIAWLEKQGKSALEARTDNELVEEEVGLVDNFSSRWVNEFNLPDGYIFKDENGNVINATKIVLEKKKKEYPKTYEECCKVLGCKADDFFTDFSYNNGDVEISDYEDKIDDLLQNFRKLRYCRDAYWKIAGEEMGLGKPWEPVYKSLEDNHYFTICTFNGKIECSATAHRNAILMFPTQEMRDAFKENFDPDIEFCKELL